MIRVIIVLIACMVAPLVQAAPPSEARSPIAIIGTGDVGSALGVSWGSLGYPIIYGSRTPDSDATRDLLSRSGDARAVLPADIAIHADVIVLALPFSAAVELLPKMGNLDGKILIDPMNALQFDVEQQRVGTNDELLAEQVQALAPGAFVVKALNAVSAANMSPDRPFKAPISIPIAGDNPAAKQTVAALIELLTLEAVDVGPLFNARYVEAMAPLYVYMNYFNRPDGGFEYAISQDSAPLSN
jgi:predicted dinucleotide-binding enzyme